ncbi:MAG: sigma 54-interacting transcriptional regulator [Longimonas sp.]|uniref:sigma 54-interacting transcriptional regulator n=1 Tax=Longimonas sp. TaxID=2039626 RepID=UPI0039749636
MKYASTIAMASSLLAEGRVRDVAHMIEPLVQGPLDQHSDADAPDAGVLRLHALWAHLLCAARLQPDDARRHLPDDNANLSAHPPRVQAEVALWRGWTDVLRGTTNDVLARGLAHLDQADRHFEALAHRPGHCWVRLGQAQAYFALDEYDLMRHALGEAQALGRPHIDRLAQCWLHDMYAPALRFQGQYAEAEAHAAALKSMAHQLNHTRWVGHAQAQEAALAYDTGAPPKVIIERATTAETRLQGATDCRPYPLLAAYHAHIGALLRAARWDEAHACIADALTAMQGYALGEAHLHSLYVRLALRRGTIERARTQLNEVMERAERLPHGLQRSHLALMRAEVARRTGDADTAHTWRARAHQNARETGHRGNQVRALLVQTQGAAEAGDIARAQTYLQKAEAFADYRSVLPMAARWSASEAALAAAQAEQSGDAQATRHAAEQYAQAHTAYRLSGDALRAAQMALHAATIAPQANRQPALRPMLVDAEAAMTRCERPEHAEQLQNVLNEWPAYDPTDTTTWGTLLGTALAEAPPEHASVTEACTTLLRAHPQVDGVRIQYRPRHARAQCMVADQGTLSSASVTALHYPAPTDARLTLTYAADEPLPDVAEALRPYLPMLLMALDRAPTPSLPSTEPTGSRFPDAFVAESAPMQALKQRIEQIGASHSPVLVTGAPGVGKTMVARAVHAVSERRTGPLHVVERTSVQPRDWAAHLFGRVDGATYTPGVLDKAEGGSVLLKAVHRLPQAVHEQLLRMLNTGCVFPVGSDTCRSIDVRLLATTPSNATTRPADAMPAALAHRLGIITLRVPPLRERRADIPVLVQRVLDEQRTPQTPLVTITQHALDALLAYDWPGNVRQLRNEVERAYQSVRSEPAPQITVDALAAPLREARTQHEDRAPHPYDTLLNDDTVALSEVLAQTEKAAIEHVLRAHDGHISASAEALDISRQGLYKKMKRLDIDADAAVSSS